MKKDDENEEGAETANFMLQVQLPASQSDLAQPDFSSIQFTNAVHVTNGERAKVSPEMYDPFHFDWPHW